MRPHRRYSAMERLKVYLFSTFLVFVVFAQSLFFKIVSVVSPTLTKTILLKLGERSTMTQNPKFRYEDWGPTFYQLAFPKAVLAFLRKSIRDEAFVGHPAPDTAVLTLEREKTSVCSFMRGDRPLVLSFGSCT
ncbi:IOD1 deiodinase, partial [Atractosteus spatula]|nr:IOD1 deiodinase [Atractosteus spatula]